MYIDFCIQHVRHFVSVQYNAHEMRTLFVAVATRVLKVGGRGTAQTKNNYWQKLQMTSLFQVTSCHITP